MRIRLLELQDGKGLYFTLRRYKYHVSGPEGVDYAVLCTHVRLRRIALYGLLIFYGLTKDELKGKKPLAKFLSIKLIVMFTFYQSFVVSLQSVAFLCHAVT